MLHLQLPIARARKKFPAGRNWYSGLGAVREFLEEDFFIYLAASEILARESRRLCQRWRLRQTGIRVGR